VQLHCEGRRLAATYATEEALHGALEGAPWEVVRFLLQPVAAGTPTI
jgi:hypothetical protein